MRLYTYHYDDAVVPSQPVIDIVVRPINGTKSAELTAIVDSGSDATLIPKKVIRRLKLRRYSNAYMRGVSGLRYQVSLYRLQLRVAGWESNLIVASDEQNEQAILGRDVLNHLRIVLNGPATTTEILSE